MIPVSITLRNFLSYGEDAPTLDFSDFQIACITGRNGHGKSALFDAITWALWGEARKAKSDRKPDEGLLRIGATDLNVTFVFDLDGRRFRISRSFRKTARSGAGSLELQVFDGDGYRTLSEAGSIRKTQARIDKLVRISYETFVNSAFILQGRVDEFTRRSPSERKAILAEILELSRYDALATRAREHARKAEDEALKEREKLSRIDEAADERPDLQRRLSEARDAMVSAESSISDSEKELEKSTQKMARVKAKLSQRSTLKAEREGTLLKKDELTVELEIAVSTVTRCEERLLSKDQIEAEVEELNRLRDQENAWRHKQTDLQALELERSRCETEIEAARVKVESRKTHWSGVVLDLTKRIAAAENALTRKPEIDARIRELAELRERDRTLRELGEEQTRLEQEHRSLAEDFNRHRSSLQVEIETCQAKRRELRGLLDRRTELERVFKDARQHLDTLEALKEEMERVKRDGTDAQRTEERLKERMEGLGQRQQQLVTQMTQLAEREEGDCPLCGSDLDQDHRTEVLEQLQKEREQLGLEKNATKTKLSETKTRRDDCRSAYQKLRDQVHPLAGASRNFARAEAELSQVARVDENLESIVLKIQKLEDEAKAFETESETAGKLKNIKEAYEQLTAQTSKHDTIRSQIDRLAPAKVEQARLLELQTLLEETRGRLPEATEKHDAAADWLKQKLYAPEAQEQFSKISEKIAEIEYHPDTHRGLLEKIESLVPSEGKLKALSDTDRDLAVAKATAESTRTRIEETEAATKQTEEEIAKLDEAEQAHGVLESQLGDLTKRVTNQRSTRDQALRSVAALERDEQASLALEDARKNTTDALRRGERDAQAYRELVKAFGRDGIQALLIDQAIPELQDEANRILSRLTANGTHITLESLSELKSGGTKETLDIRISDELGERRYELYSGGEAFRVDFAIRIALSKLLARRSGTPLQTLVIDEGFGTQDEQGLIHLIEAIQTISDEFEKVLVITHVETIKNAFPVRIEVVKHAESGSTFSIAS